MKKTILLVSFLILGAATTTEVLTGCKKLQSNLPCTEIPKCSEATISNPPISITTLSSGATPHYPTRAVSTEACYDSYHLHLTFSIENQRITSSLNSKYNTCNSAIYNLDVLEVFIAPFTSSLNCYTEMDVSMLNTPFFSGIYNPNLNHTGISNYLISPCVDSGIITTTTNNYPLVSNAWNASFQIPMDVISHPKGCPNSPNNQSFSNVLRGNFYRINSLSDAVMVNQKCTEELCDYLAWSPNGVSPPSFHEPNYFGYLVLV